MTKDKKNILIVEDEKSMAKILQVKLKKEGFDAEIATDGSLALTMLEKGDYDLVLLDLVMPKMDGYEVLAIMKDKGIVTPVFVLSNLGQGGDEDKAKELGARRFLIKSDTPMSDVVRYINEVI